MKIVKHHLSKIGMVMLAAFFFVAVMGVFADSYAKGRSHGKLRYNPQVVPKFGSSVKLADDLDVYFYGSADRPDAVIAIFKGTPFDSETWRPIAPEAEEIGKWRYLIENYNDMLAQPYFGYDILDPDGKQVGYWLSYVRRTVIKMTKDDKIAVYPPDTPLRWDSGSQRIGP